MSAGLFGRLLLGDFTKLAFGYAGEGPGGMELLQPGHGQLVPVLEFLVIEEAVHEGGIEALSFRAVLVQLHAQSMRVVRQLIR